MQISAQHQQLPSRRNITLVLIPTSLDRYSMLRIGLAPHLPFGVSQDLMVASAKLARQYPGVRLHTHMAENQQGNDFLRTSFGLTPGEYIK